jgi:prepilin-type processing-associated H-X9-DG protein
MLVFEIASSAGTGTGQDHTHSRNWLNGWNSVLEDIQPDRHGSTANYLFADWHVGALEASLLKKRIDAGDNFAKPPR